MDRFVARENIKHYRLLIEQATDAVEKERLLKMLSEEEAKLQVAEAQYRAAKKEEANRTTTSGTTLPLPSKQD